MFHRFYVWQFCSCPYDEKVNIEFGNIANISTNASRYEFFSLVVFKLRGGEISSPEGVFRGGELSERGNFPQGEF